MGWSPGSEHAPLLESFFQSLIPYFNLQDELPADLAEIKINECLTLLENFDPRDARRYWLHYMSRERWIWWNLWNAISCLTCRLKNSVT